MDDVNPLSFPTPFPPGGGGLLELELSEAEAGRDMGGLRDCCVNWTRLRVRMFYNLCGGSMANAFPPPRARALVCVWGGG